MSVRTKGGVDGLDDIRADHGDFIDDHHIQRENQFFSRKLYLISSRCKSRAGNRKNEWIVCPSTFDAATPVGASTTNALRMLGEITQQGGLAGARLAGDEQAGVHVFAASKIHENSG